MAVFKQVSTTFIGQTRSPQSKPTLSTLLTSFSAFRSGILYRLKHKSVHFNESTGYV